MKRKLHLWVMLLWILVMITACSSGGNEASDPADTTDPADSGSAGSEQGEAVAHDDDIVTLSLFINHSWYPLSSWEGTIAEEITKRTGVALDVTVAADTQQLPMMIASGDLPDLVFTLREARLENPDISYPWNELIEQYAPNFEIDPIRLGVNTAPDGNVYTILNAFATPEEWENEPYALGNDGNPGIAVRQDMMEELGIRPIESLEDLTSAFEQVKKQYPDMVPLTMDIEWIPQYFRLQFGIPPHSSWYDDDGQLRHVITHPRMGEFYKFMNELYRNDYILAENFTYSNDQIDNEYAESGRAFAHSHTVSIAETDNVALEHIGADYRFEMIPTVLTDDAVNISSGTGFSGVYITKNNSNPEASIKLLEFMATQEGKELIMFGIEGEHWQWHEDGYPEFNYNVNDEDYVNEEGLKWWYLYSDGIVEGLRGYVPGTQSTQALQEIKEVTEYRPDIGMVQLQDGTDEKVTYDRIEEMIENEEIKAYLAESEEAAEQAYLHMVQLAEDIGLEQLENWATEELQQAQQLFESLE